MPMHFYSSTSFVCALIVYAAKRVAMRSSVDLFANGRAQKTYRVCWA
jgi:hypothetical protein